jgi:Reverse transcriptase (RNA-dependent DNA polymerase)
MISEEYIKIINNTITFNDQINWRKLLLFPYYFLSLPENRDKESITSIIRNNIQNGYDREFSIKKKKKTSSLNNLILSKISEGNIKGALNLLSSGDTIAISDELNYNNLKSKHLSKPTDLCFPTKPTNGLINNFYISPEEIKKAILSFPCGSSAGYDALFPQHLKDMINLSNDISKKLLEALCKLINLIFQGNIPEDICPILYGANLIALKKKDGGTRPIAIGLVLRRLAAKVCVKRLKSKAITYLQPLQMGFGIKSGAEAIVHASRYYLNNNNEYILCKLDFQNAFNSIRRDKMMEAIKSFCPEFFQYINQCYSKSSNLLFGKFLINSENGVQQGDPLEPLLFSLTLQPGLLNLKSKFKSAYLDDLTICGSFTDISNDIQEIIKFGQTIGLHLNTSKCEIYMKNQNLIEKEKYKMELQNYLPNIKFLEEDLELLGAALDNKALEKILKNKIEIFKNFTEKLKQIDTHAAFFLLKHCLSIQKMIYVLRTSPTWNYIELLQKWDIILLDNITSLCNINISDNIKKQIFLPVSYGGLGLGSAEEISPCAYNASIFSCLSMTSSILGLDNPELLINEESINFWKSKALTDIPILSKTIKQKNWNIPITKNNVEGLCQKIENNNLQKTRFLAVSNKESGLWLNVLPSKNLGTLLDDNTFKIAINLRLGGSFLNEFQCKCGKIVDKYGYHGLSCRYDKGKWFRHTLINQTIQKALTSAGNSATLEPIGISRNDGKRPDGVTYGTWSEGKFLTWDSTCVNPLADSYLQKSCIERRYTANLAETKKINKYANLPNNYIFMPLGFEVFGAWGFHTHKLIKEIGTKMTAKNGDIRSTTFLGQKLSIDLQKGNSMAIIATLPNTMSLDEVFHLP